MTPATRAKNKNAEKENANKSNTAANAANTSGASATPTATNPAEQASGLSANASTNTEPSESFDSILNPTFPRPLTKDVIVSAHGNSVSHLFGAMTDTLGPERAAIEWAKLVPGPVVEVLNRTAAANKAEANLSAKTSELTINDPTVNAVNTNTNETAASISNDSQSGSDAQQPLHSSTPNPNDGSDANEDQGSHRDHNETVNSNATDTSNTNNTTNSFSFSKEELAQLLVQAARKHEHGETFNNLSLQRIPELYAYGSSPNGTRTARPQLVFEKIEEIFSQESQRKDALRLRIRGLASNCLYDYLASNPHATYEEQKQTLLRRFKVKLTKTEFMLRFQNLKKEENETLSHYVERISRLANNFRESNIESVTEELIDNLSCAALFPYIPLWVGQRIRHLETMPITGG